MTIFSLCLGADEVEAARRHQVDYQGYTLPDNYTLKLAQLAKREAKTERTNSGIVTTFDSRLPRSLWPSFIHHEYAHACQIALGGPSQSVFMDEASATLQEMLAFKQSLSWQSSIDAFQARTQIPPFVDTDTKFDCGGALFLFFLEQAYGDNDGRLVRRLWSRAQPALPNVDNRAWIKLVELETGHDITELILKFANFRLAYPPLKIMTLASGKRREVFMTKDEWPLPLGCTVMLIPSCDEPCTVKTRIESTAPLALASQKADDSGWQFLASPRAENSFTLAAGQDLYLSVCNVDKKSFMLGDLSAHPLKVFFEVLP